MLCCTRYEAMTEAAAELIRNAAAQVRLETAQVLCSFAGHTLARAHSRGVVLRIEKAA